MIKSIYKITNIINNKVYIGQSNNPQKRWKEHIRLGKNNKNSKLYSAINKYGVNNFIFEIIEENIKNYNEREKYWIKYYNSIKNGYNICIGGEEPPIHYGEDSILSKYSNDIILKIQKDLINNISFQEISNKYNISCEYLSFINRGISRKNSEFNYPLQRKNNTIKTKQIIGMAENLLNYTTFSELTICNFLNIKRKTLDKINKGIHKYSNKKISFPIRKENYSISDFLFDKIVLELRDNRLKMKEIEDKYNISHSTLSRLNQGITLKHNNIKYPIRNSKHRVYK